MLTNLFYYTIKYRKYRNIRCTNIFFLFFIRDFEGGTLGLAWTGDLKNAGGVCERNGVSNYEVMSVNLIKGIDRVCAESSYFFLVANSFSFALYLNPSIHPILYWSLFLTASLSFWLSICRSVCVSVCLSI